MTEDKDIHDSARALIIEAAEKSGLLKSVAELLWFANEHPSAPGGDCVVCELLHRLTEDLDDHVVLPNIVADDMYGEGVNIDPSPGTESVLETFK
jgi:hypothetical protein